MWIVQEGKGASWTMRGGKMSRRGWSWVLFWMVPLQVAASPQSQSPHYGHTGFELSLKPHHCRVIDEIISTIDRSNTLMLGFQSGHLTRLGESIHEIGVLQFLGHIFTQAPLRNSMKRIKNNWFKWNGFVHGFEPRVEREANTEAFIQHVKSFAHYLGLPAEPLVQYARAHDWDAFIDYLVQHT